MKPEGDRFTKHFVQGWNKWIVVDHKFQQDNEVRDWRKKGHPDKLPVWKGTEEDADHLSALLNRAYLDDDALITQVEAPHRGVKAWPERAKQLASKRHARQRQVANKANLAAFKKCHCGARYKGDTHCG